MTRKNKSQKPRVDQLDDSEGGMSYEVQRSRNRSSKPSFQSTTPSAYLERRAPREKSTPSHNFLPSDPRYSANLKDMVQGMSSLDGVNGGRSTTPKQMDYPPQDRSSRQPPHPFLPQKHGSKRKFPPSRDDPDRQRDYDSRRPSQEYVSLNYGGDSELDYEGDLRPGGTDSYRPDRRQHEHMESFREGATGSKRSRMSRDDGDRLTYSYGFGSTRGTDEPASKPPLDHAFLSRPSRKFLCPKHPKHKRILAATQGQEQYLCDSDIKAENLSSKQGRSIFVSETGLKSTDPEPVEDREKRATFVLYDFGAGFSCLTVKEFGSAVVVLRRTVDKILQPIKASLGYIGCYQYLPIEGTPGLYMAFESKEAAVDFQVALDVSVAAINERKAYSPSRFGVGRMPQERDLLYANADTILKFRRHLDKLYAAGAAEIGQKSVATRVEKARSDVKRADAGAAVEEEVEVMKSPLSPIYSPDHVPTDIDGGGSDIEYEPSNEVLYCKKCRVEVEEDEWWR